MAEHFKVLADFETTPPNTRDEAILARLLATLVQREV
jgi:hypothetical protein